MKIAIHHSKISFSEKWIEYCKSSNIPYKIVDCYKSDIIQQLADCDALMWHFHHANPKDVKFAKQLLYSVQASGKKVFPDFNTVWHFDDKVGQKYLFDSIGAPVVPTYIFYSKAEAKTWVNQASFPKVFKLRGGGGSANVRLVKTRKQAIRLINKAFGSGFRQYNPYNGLKERWRKYKNGKTGLMDLVEGLARFFLRTEFEKTVGKEKGYVYFQDFIEDCSFDIRLKIVKDKCWVIKRMIRPNDFRASGSDSHVYSAEGIPIELISTAFELRNKMHLQCVAFDFLLSKENIIYLTEISYGFGYTDAQFYGYWDSELIWHTGTFNPFGWMVENIVNEIRKNEA